MTDRRAVFIDRDGTINELVAEAGTGGPESPLRPQDVELIQGAPEGLLRLAEAGWLLVGVSNQPAAAKGAIGLEQLLATHSRVLELLAARGVRFDDFRLCLHHPQGTLPELTRVCECRKPAPGMLREAAGALGVDLARSWLIGDTDSDIAAGQAAGCATILIEHPGSAHKRRGDIAPDAVAKDLYAAAELLLAQAGGPANA